MEILSYILALVISFSGLFLGSVLAFIAPEELKAGKKFFIIIRSIVLAFILYFILEMFKVHIAIIIIVSIAVLLFSHLIDTRAIYVFLALIFFLSSKYQTVFFIEASLIFIYGFPVGTMFTYKFITKTKPWILRMLSLNYCSFLIIGLVLLVLAKII